ncbi:MAG: D-tyrosyl-tRNA(Tyr) deacylase [Candidatus Eisenbacteria bacterium]|uniref:D-aminoacyl-tRNA deacylase n=1 Tax=Eiseniibacteriota bacterium TaxID=2212470 RepID=A0A849T0Z3_UNCEI|nr:D-tyrosyl-tRNA(Tyr) deacylase [Candidatus Eisenbacteria bacterium]
MRALVQRVSEARVSVDGTVRGAIAHGLVVLLGATHADTVAEADALARKLAGLRIFPDASERMNLDVSQVAGAVLVVPQFTLYGDANSGRRPDFVRAARPEIAEPLFERFCESLAAIGVPVARGVFRTHMEVALVNDGPVTLWLEIEPPAARA